MIRRNMDATGSANEENPQNSWGIYGAAGVVTVMAAGGIIKKRSESVKESKAEKSSYKYGR